MPPKRKSSAKKVTGSTTKSKRQKTSEKPEKEQKKESSDEEKQEESESIGEENTKSGSGGKQEQEESTIYNFSAKTLDGNLVSLDKYKGHVCIIVNVASRCGHTKSNYEQFVEIYDKYADSKGLRILAFPCNQFGSQEPGDSAKICEFIKKKNVKFDVFEKIKVNGPDTHPLWKFLKETLPAKTGKDIKWNFTKFIIDKNGVPVERHVSSVKPLKLVESLEKLW